MTWKTYRKTQLAEMRPYSPGEALPPTISIGDHDRDNGSPKEGDMIARNPVDRKDTWLVAARFFRDNYEEVT